MNEGTYSDLADEIGSGGNITLDKDIYIYDSGSTIKITTPCIIDGNNTVIDMKYSNFRIFDIVADGVVLKNINFRNVDLGRDDGAVRFLNSGIVDNCNFNNDDTAGHWKVIFIENQYEVRNCNFTEIIPDYAIGSGQDINGTIENCDFN